MRLFLLCLTSVFSFGTVAQTKEQLVNEIINMDQYQDPISYAYMQDPPGYALFRKLKVKLTPPEVRKFSKHSNNALRMYFVADLIEANGEEAVGFLTEEFRRKEKVNTLEGCIAGDEPTSQLVYFFYRRQLAGKAQEQVGTDEGLGKLRDSIMMIDKTLAKLDSIVLYQDGASWLVYNRAFTRKYSETYLPRIEQLAFTHNNFYALQYLLANYGNRYNARVANYWKEGFAKAKFKDNDSLFHFVEFITLMLQTKDDELKEIAIAKLKKVKNWRDMGTDFVTMLKKRVWHCNSRHGLEMEDTIIR